MLGRWVRNALLLTAAVVIVFLIVVFATWLEGEPTLNEWVFMNGRWYLL